MIGLRLGKKCEHARGNVAAAGEQKGPPGQASCVDFNDYFTRKVRKDMSAHLADTKTQTALTVLLAVGGSSDVLN
jgi:hypothetical protein